MRRFFSAFVFSLFFLFPSALYAVVESGAEKRELNAPVQVIDPVMISRLDSAKTPIQRISSNTTVIPKRELKADKPRTLQEAMRNQEGIVMFDGVGNGLDSTFSLRGFNESSAVTFLVDGMRVNEVDGNLMTFPLVPMDDIDQIQIERGSASPVYGSNALAGVINITTGRPSKKPASLFGGFDVSSHHGIRFYQGMSGTVQDKVSPLGGAWEYYFRGGRNNGEGFQGNSEYRITNFDFKTAYVLPEESGKVFLNMKRVQDMVSNPGEMTFEQYQQSAKQTNKPNDYRKFRNNSVQIGGDKKFWDNKITASLLNNWRFNNSDFINTVTQFGTNTTLIESKAHTRELTGQLAYEDAWGWLKNLSLIGFEVRKSSELATRIAAPGGEVPPSAVTTLDRNTEVFNSALFWNERLGLTDYADVHAGMRHDRYTLQTHNPKSPSSDYTSRWKYSALSTGVTFHPVKSADLFFQFSEGFRIPDISDVNPFVGAAPPDYLKPERSDQYEVGARYRFRDLFKLRNSWFLIDMQDEIVNDTSAVTPTNPFGQNINVGKSRRYGTELGAEVTPLPEAGFFGTWTWTRAYVRETNIDPFGGQIFDGRDLGQIPRNRLTWGAEFRPLIRVCDVMKDLKFRIDGTFTGKQHPQSYETTTQAMLDDEGGAGHIIKSYALWNFLASYAFKNQEIYFKINNMFDNKYYSRAVVSEIFGAGTYPTGVHTFVNSGAPREMILGFRWEIE